jgi:hypothetical protein
MAMFWSYQLQDKQYYIKKFKNIFTYKVYAHNGAWYAPKYEWRICFDVFREDRNRRSATLEWAPLIMEMRDNDFKFKTRLERAQNLYTSDVRLLEFLINKIEYHKKICSISYSSEIYLSEYNKKDEISTDVKLVKRVPSHSYIVEIGGLYKAGRQCALNLTSYILSNKNNFYFTGYYKEIIDRMAHSPVRPIWDGFTFYVKEYDDVMMLHLVAPGHIKKVTQLVSKGKTIV